MAYTPLDPTVLTGVLNNQGTQATSANQVVHTGLLTTGNAVATVIMNDQGTLASAVQQAYTNSLLQSIYAQAGTVNGSLVTATLFSEQVGAANSIAVDVSGRLYNTVQHVINGNCSVTTQTSLDGSNWNDEHSVTQSALMSLVGMTKYIRAAATAGGTVTSLLMSSPPMGGNSAPTTSLSEGQFTGVISKTLNATTVFPVNNANSLGFQLTIPVGGMVAFEGSWDGLTWEASTFRQMGSDGYAASAHANEKWIGSCSTFNYIRFRTISAGSVDGSITGKFTYQQNTVEGIEHGPMPHRFGAFPHEVVTTIGTICVNQLLYQPEPQHLVTVTDIWLNAGGLTTVTLTESGTRPVFRCTLRPTAGAPFASMSYRVPVPFSGTGAPLMISNSAAQDVDIVVHLYESEL